LEVLSARRTEAMAARRLAATLRSPLDYWSLRAAGSGAAHGWSASAVAAPSHCPYSTASGSSEQPALYGGQTLEEIRSRIFGVHIGSGLPSGRKLLRKKLVGDKIASYYGQPVEQSDPLFEYLDEERRKLKLDKLKRRGKAPPKKGAGKRSGKK